MGHLYQSLVLHDRQTKNGQTAFELVGFTVITCGACGVTFALTTDHQERLNRTKDWFYCPNGDKIHYSGPRVDTFEFERIKSELDREKVRLRALEGELSVSKAKEYKAKEKIKNQAATLKRVHAGVCPCCNRTFQDLARHMKSMHPASLKDFEKPNPLHVKISSKK